MATLVAELSLLPLSAPRTLFGPLPVLLTPSLLVLLFTPAELVLATRLLAALLWLLFTPAELRSLLSLAELAASTLLTLSALLGLLLLLTRSIGPTLLAASGLSATPTRLLAALASVLP